jgi:hypothetical protein
MGRFNRGLFVEVENSEMGRMVWRRVSSGDRAGSRLQVEVTTAPSKEHSQVESQGMCLIETVRRSRE